MIEYRFWPQTSTLFNLLVLFPLFLSTDNPKAIRNKQTLEMAKT